MGFRPPDNGAARFGPGEGGQRHIGPRPLHRLGEVGLIQRGDLRLIGEQNVHMPFD